VRFISWVALALCFILGSPIPRVALAASGHLDPAFGGDGKVLTRFVGGGDAQDMAIQADGEIVAVGRAGSPDVDWALARFKNDGSLDRTFGRDGRVTTHFTRHFEFATGVAIQANGKIVAVGGVDGRFGLARYRPNGILDPGFGGDGRVLTSFAGVEADPAAVAIRSDGKIVVLGTTTSLTCCPRLGEFALARFNPDGTLDDSFGGNGKVTASLTGTYDTASDLAIQADGKVVAVGSGDGQFEAARFTADGALDPSFDVDGIVLTDITIGDDSASGVAVQDDGKIVVAGDAGFCCEYTSSFALVRYETDGTLDTTFDGDGEAITDFTPDDDSAADVAIQGDGRIVAGGSAGFNGSRSWFALARYEPDGTLDTSFNNDGMAMTSFDRAFDFARGMGIQTNGKIVLAGGAFDGTTDKMALARYLG
jgi:uncharacterized delta-60 repeat protein